MESSSVLYEVENQIATITLNRPKSLNSMNDTLVSELAAALKRAGSDESVRIVVLTGNGRAFCAGGDLGYLSELSGVIETKIFIEKVGALVEQIQNLRQPVIAMVNGVAAGAGFNLALAADLVYCAKSARFAQSFAKVGLVPDCAGMYLLPRVVGIHKAKELMFTADLIGAEEAHRLGLVNQIAEDAELKETTYALADKIKGMAPLALTLIKRTLQASDSLALKDLLAQEAALQTLCMQTEDHKEGVLAFKEKRTPLFQGR